MEPNLREFRTEGLAARILAGVASLFATWILATTLYGIASAYSPLPFWDEWDSVTAAQHLSRLVEQHNEHRIVLSRLVFIADKAWFSGSNKLSLAVLLIIQLLHVALLVYVFSRARSLQPEETIGAWAIAISMLFWFWQSETLAWGFNVHFVTVYALATASLAIYALDNTRSGLAITVLLASIATFTMANGLLLFPLLVSLAVWLRRPRGQLVFLVIATAVVWSIFFWGYRFGVHEPERGAPLFLLIHAIGYALAFIGGPFGGPLGHLLESGPSIIGLRPGIWPQAISMVIGGGGLAFLILAGAYLAAHRKKASPAQLVLLHLMMFVLATALLTASGRMQFGLSQALSPRYGTAALLFWTAASFLLWSLVSRDNHSLRNLVLAGIAVVGLFAAWTQLPLIGYAENATLTRKEAETALLSRVHDPEVLSRIYPNVLFVEQQAELLRKERISIFVEPWSHWLGASIAQHAQVTSADACLGYLDEITPLTSTTPSGWRARGWAWDRLSQSTPEAILLALEDGTIVGFALPGFARPDVRRLVSEVKISSSGWQGHLSVARPQRIIAFALLRRGLIGGREVCPLRSSDNAIL